MSHLAGMMCRQSERRQALTWEEDRRGARREARPRTLARRYRGPDGRERSQTFDRRVDAERWLAGVTVSTAKGEWIDPALGRVTFAE